MTLEELEARIQTIEDIEAIKKLQRAYCYYLEHWQDEEIISLWSQSPDVSVEIGDSGFYKGKEGVIEFFTYSSHFFTSESKPPPEFLHLLMPLAGIVDVDPDGKTAKGRWYGLGHMAIPRKGKARAIISSGIWENEYVKEDGKWKIKKLLFYTIFGTPFEDSWVKTSHFERPIPLAKRPPPSANNIAAAYPSGYVFPYHYKNPVTGK